MPLTPELEDAIRRAHEATSRYGRHPRKEALKRGHELDEWLDTLRNDPVAFEAWFSPIRDRANQLNQDTRVKAEVEKKKAAEANERAEKLLQEVLSPAQRAELQRKNYFHVRANGRRFRITRGWAGNVLEVDARSRLRYRFCAHPNQHVPAPDVMLAQKLVLESEPERFFSVANKSQVRRLRRAS